MPNDLSSTTEGEQTGSQESKTDSNDHKAAAPESVLPAAPKEQERPLRPDDKRPPPIPGCEWRGPWDVDPDYSNWTGLNPDLTPGSREQDPVRRKIMNDVERRVKERVARFQAAGRYDVAPTLVRRVDGAKPKVVGDRCDLLAARKCPTSDLPGHSGMWVLVQYVDVAEEDALDYWIGLGQQRSLSGEEKEHAVLLRLQRPSSIWLARTPAYMAHDLGIDEDTVKRIARDAGIVFAERYVAENGKRYRNRDWPAWRTDAAKSSTPEIRELNDPARAEQAPAPEGGTDESGTDESDADESDADETDANLDPFLPDAPPEPPPPPPPYVAEGKPVSWTFDTAPWIEIVKPEKVPVTTQIMKESSSGKRYVDVEYTIPIDWERLLKDNVVGNGGKQKLQPVSKTVTITKDGVRVSSRCEQIEPPLPPPDQAKATAPTVQPSKPSEPPPATGFRVAREALEAALAAVKPAMSAASTGEMSTHYLFRKHLTDATKIEILTYTGRLVAAASFAATVGPDVPSFTIEGKGLRDFMSTTESEPVTFTVDGRKIMVTIGDAANTFLSLDPVSFPYWDKTFASALPTAKINAVILRDAVVTAGMFTAAETSKDWGIQVAEVRPGGVLAATNKVRLCLATVPGLKDARFRVHTKDVGQISRFLGLCGREELEVREAEFSFYLVRPDGSYFGETKFHETFKTVGKLPEHDQRMWEVDVEALERAIKAVQAGVPKCEDRLWISRPDDGHLLLQMEAETGDPTQARVAVLSSTSEEGAPALPDRIEINVDNLMVLLKAHGKGTIKLGVNYMPKVRSGYFRATTARNSNSYVFMTTWNRLPLPPKPKVDVPASPEPAPQPLPPERSTALELATPEPPAEVAPHGAAPLATTPPEAEPAQQPRAFESPSAPTAPPAQEAAALEPVTPPPSGESGAASAPTFGPLEDHEVRCRSGKTVEVR